MVFLLTKKVVQKVIISHAHFINHCYLPIAGFGYADIENHIPCKSNTVMRIASISKSITMAVVAK